MNKNELSAGTAADKRTAADSIPSASLVQNGLLGADLDWCFAFESRVETLRILNIIPDSNLTDKGHKSKSDLQKWINENADRYLTLTGR